MAFGLLVPLLLLFGSAKAQETTTPAHKSGKEELQTHFRVQEQQLESIEDVLHKLKVLAHRRTFHRDFGSDAAKDADKVVKIASDQPDVSKEVEKFLFEGDIFLSKKQAISILKEVSHMETKKKRLRRFVSDPDAVWKSFPIRYKFHESLDFYAISQIISAIRYWESRTCITFENNPDISELEDHIEFFRGLGCYSMIGRNGGRQGVSIGENCVKLGVIEHEIGHALGLWHEQSRPDAMNFVKVEKDFILPSYVSDFLQRDSEIDTLGIPYDLGSVMHYGSTAFSADQMTKTILTRDPLYQATIGQREALSFYDIMTINTAYCKNKCAGRPIVCKNGGYPHPGNCRRCICPNGLGGKDCSQNEKPLNAQCGEVVLVRSDWTEIESPGYSDSGYESNQKCSWLFKVESGGERIEFEFIDDFSFLCTTTCIDYVELKLAKDLRNTGFRICCENRPEGTFVSEASTAAVVFRSALSDDIGFKLRARSTSLPARTTPSPLPRTTTAIPTTIAGFDVWAPWGEWSQCSRSCGGCGIRSRVRTCRTSDCTGRRQEFSTCNMQACPVDKHCARLLSPNRLCEGRVCTKVLNSLVRCDQPQCCPPFYNNNGICQNDEAQNDFEANE